MPAPSRPNNFDNYWGQVRLELEAIPMAAEEEHLAIRSTEFCECYTVRVTSVGPYRLFGYLSIPHGDPPFPAIFNGSSYRSAVEPLFQGEPNDKCSRFVILSMAARGQRHADKPFAAEYPGLFTEGIDTPQTYIYRGIVADWLRAVDYLLTRPEVDRTRIAAVKHNSLPILAAALRPKLTHVIAQPGSFFGVHDKTSAEIEDYLRMFPGKRDPVERTLSYFNPLFFAEAVRARTLLWGDDEQLEPLTTAIAGESDVHPSEQSQFKDGLFEEIWLSEQLGFADPIIPSCWQR
jgi:cephalosporin-C deacetylase